MSRAPLHVLAAGLVCAWLLPIARCAKAARAAPARQVPSARSSAASPRAGALLMSDDFNRANGPNHLISNEWSYWDHNDSARVRSPVWQVTSGTLFSVKGSGWTGVPDDTPPDRYSEQHTDSQVLRVYTSRGNFGDVLQELDARINGFTASAGFPALAWDGVVLWPRYVSPFHLYFAYLLRKDGRVAITKKCPGHVPGGDFYNGGSYFELSSERYLAPTVYGRWYRLASSAQDNPDGSVTVRTFRDGRLVAQATDRGVGCAPIKGPTHLGIRADNADASFRRYRVHELSPLPATSCPDSLVGPAREVALLAERSRARARVHAGRCPAAFLPTGP